VRVYGVTGDTADKPSDIMQLGLALICEYVGGGNWGEAGKYRQWCNCDDQRKIEHSTNNSRSIVTGAMDV